MCIAIYTYTYAYSCMRYARAEIQIWLAIYVAMYFRLFSFRAGNVSSYCNKISITATYTHFNALSYITKQSVKVI